MSGQQVDTDAGKPRYIRVPDTEFERLQAIARDEQRTAAGEIRRLIQKRIAEVDEREAA